MPKLTMTEDEILTYLDGAITKWRLIKHKHSDDFVPNKLHMAICYIDAFQSVRDSLFGEVLPVEAPSTPSKK